MVGSRSRTLAKLPYEPRADTLQHGYEYAPLNIACWPGTTVLTTKYRAQISGRTLLHTAMAEGCGVDELGVLLAADPTALEAQDGAGLTPPQLAKDMPTPGLRI